jgi:hypothetical protein
VEPLDPSAAPAATDGPAGKVALDAGVDIVRVDPSAVQDDGQIAEDDLDELLAALPDVGEPDLLREVLALTDPKPGQEAAIATVEAAGAVKFEVPGGDPAADREAVAMLDEAQALTVVGVGPTFGTPDLFAWRVGAAEKGALLPTGTQQLFPARYVTTTAHEWDDPEAVVARAAADAEEYDTKGVPAVPTVAVRASAASSYAGDDGDWVLEEPIDELRPLVDAARAADQYVLLEVGAGPGPVVDQVRELEPLLSKPGVGVALYPEQRRGDGTSTTSEAMGAGEIGAVLDYLADVTTREALPATMLVVHQTRADSVPDREILRSTPQVQVVIAADRTGGTTTGEWVWTQLTKDVPKSVRLGWSGPASVFPGAAAAVPSQPAPVLVAAS